MIVENLAARPARTGVGHLPEVVALVFGAPGLSPMRTQRSAGTPISFVQIRTLRRPRDRRSSRASLRELVNLGQQLPREADRVALEVVAEAEVAEHLEERVMARGVADVLEIVVLAARAHAALRGRRAHVGPLLLPQENVLELDHPRVREEQRGSLPGTSGLDATIVWPLPRNTSGTCCGFRCFSWGARVDARSKIRKRQGF